MRQQLVRLKRGNSIAKPNARGERFVDVTRPFRSLRGYERNRDISPVVTDDCSTRVMWRVTVGPSGVN